MPASTWWQQSSLGIHTHAPRTDIDVDAAPRGKEEPAAVGVHTLEAGRAWDVGRLEAHGLHPGAIQDQGNPDLASTQLVEAPTRRLTTMRR